ncbi:hypothetical protein VNO77_18970 [Canavalia gladiata]|uniref:Uncharacterized protein n=1 Tax=Canavalia gladiata TaxID=3824 RepID=A0AAN9LRQ0_CANGL
MPCMGSAGECAKFYFDCMLQEVFCFPPSLLSTEFVDCLHKPPPRMRYSGNSLRPCKSEPMYVLASHSTLMCSKLETRGPLWSSTILDSVLAEGLWRVWQHLNRLAKRLVGIVVLKIGFNVTFSEYMGSPWHHRKLIVMTGYWCQQLKSLFDELESVASDVNQSVDLDLQHDKGIVFFLSPFCTPYIAAFHAPVLDACDDHLGLDLRPCKGSKLSEVVTDMNLTPYILENFLRSCNELGNFFSVLDAQARTGYNHFILVSITNGLVNYNSDYVELRRGHEFTEHDSWSGTAGVSGMESDPDVSHNLQGYLSNFLCCRYLIHNHQMVVQLIWFESVIPYSFFSIISIRARPTELNSRLVRNYIKVREISSYWFMEDLDVIVLPFQLLPLATWLWMPPLLESNEKEKRTFLSAKNPPQR